MALTYSAVVYSDKFARPDPYAFSRAELFHSDVTYEVQPPGTTILKLYLTPEVGNDTLWSSGYVSSHVPVLAPLLLCAALTSVAQLCALLVPVATVPEVP